MAKQLQALEIDEKTATRLIKKAKKYKAYTDPVPKTEKGKLEAAEGIISFCVDAWVTDEVRPDDKDADSAEAAEQILELFEIVGIEVDDDDDLVFPGEENNDSDDDDEDEEDEAAVEIDDIIEDYDDLSAVAKVKAIKKKKLDADDEDDVAVLDSIRTYELEQDKPASRVVDFINELIGEPDEEDDDDEEEESEEPIEGYDDASVKELKEALTGFADEDELDEETLESIIEYEEENKNRKSLLKWMKDDLAAMLEEDDEDDDDDDEDEDEEENDEDEDTDEDEDEVDIDSLADEISKAIVKVLKKHIE